MNTIMNMYNVNLTSVPIRRYCYKWSISVC